MSLKGFLIGKGLLAGGGDSGGTTVDPNDKGWFLTEAALNLAYPAGEVGWYANVGSTETIWVWDEGSVAWVDTNISYPILEGVFTPQDYGAVGDGVTDDSIAFQAMFDAVNILNPEICYIPPSRYIINTQIDLPRITGSSTTLLITGYGATLKTTSGITILKRIPTDQSDASILVSAKISIEGIKFQGTRLAGSMGLYLGATYGSVIKDCFFIGFENGCKLAFALMTAIQSTLFQDCSVRHLDISYGGDWGGSTANSQSNSTTLRDIRIYSRAAAESCVHIEACSGIHLDNVIFEGGNPVDNLVFNGRNATVVREFSCRGLHLENTPSNSHIKLLSSTSGDYSFRNIFTQYASILIDNQASSTIIITVEDVPVLPSGTTFSGDGNWIFRNSLSLENVVSDPIYWEDSVYRGRYFGANNHPYQTENTLSVAADVVDINWLKKRDFVATNRVTLASNTEVIFSNAANSIFGIFKFNVVGGNTITFPLGSVSGDDNFSAGVWTAPASGNFTASFYNAASEYEIVFTQNPS